MEEIPKSGNFTRKMNVDKDGNLSEFMPIEPYKPKNIGQSVKNLLHMLTTLFKTEQKDGK